MNPEWILGLGRNHALITISSPEELAYWTAQFGVAATTLQQAIDAVGPSYDAVRDYLARSSTAPMAAAKSPPR